MRAASSPTHAEKLPVEQSSLSHTKAGVRAAVNVTFQEDDTELRVPSDLFYAESYKLLVKEEAQTFNGAFLMAKMMSARTPTRKQMPRSHTNWVDNAAVSVCPQCSRQFHKFRWRHHCRLCGQIFCHDCCRYSVRIHRPHYGDGIDKQKRVCGKCYGEKTECLPLEQLNSFIECIPKEAEWNSDLEDASQQSCSEDNESIVQDSRQEGNLNLGVKPKHGGARVEKQKRVCGTCCGEQDVCLPLEPLHSFIECSPKEAEWNNDREDASQHSCSDGNEPGLPNN
jgi:hypothetical protein